MNLRTGIFSANEKGMQYPPELANIFQKASYDEQLIEINLIENEKEIMK